MTDLATRAEAAAPEEARGLLEELVNALYQYRSDLLYPPAPDSRERRLAMIEGLTTKVAGK